MTGCGMKLPQSLFVSLLLLTALLRAQDAEPPRPAFQQGKADPGTPVPDPAAAAKRIKQTGPDLYELGQITFNAKTREVRLPCAVNMIKGDLEYLLVHETGKTHESLLKTTINALDLQVVLLLTNYQPGHTGLFFYEAEEARKRHEATAPKTPGANLVKIELEWQDGAQTKHAPATQWLLTAPQKKTPSDITHWTFNGSMLQPSGFSAALYGNFFALYYDATAIINCPSKLNAVDDVWSPNTPEMPKEDTPVTVTITPVASNS